MTAIHSRDLSPTQLAAMLRAWAEGHYASEAAVELLIAHGTWLARRDFRTRLVDAVDDGWSRRGTVAMASIDWPAVPHFLDETTASSSEAAILRIATSLAGTNTGTLRDLTSSLDPKNTELMLQSLAHSAGWHEHRRQALITGDVAARSRNAGRAGSASSYGSPSTGPTR